MTAARRPRVRGRDVIAPRAGVASVVVDHETVIYDETTNSLHVLDRIATVIWSCLDGEGTLDEITADLAEAFGAPLPQIRSDVRALVRRLDRLGLVDGVGGVAGAGAVGGVSPVLGGDGAGGAGGAGGVGRAGGAGAGGAGAGAGGAAAPAAAGAGVGGVDRVGGAAPVATRGRARSRSRYLREAPNL